MACWLALAMTRVPDKHAMGGVLRQWIEQCSSLEPPAGRWAIELAASGDLVGGAAVLPLPPDGIDLEIGWQPARPFWGRGLATEVVHGAAHYAFTAGADEVFAVCAPATPVESRPHGAWA
ncbi:GNAT family N-acetyltransferase [Streptomyces sp. NPDC004074]|uniref:GNAT family N-acetyltransferase n=1 Tax=Streptomyces sp. NPDC004074 TaxID=3154277 RepID=UPI0033AE3717